jgi:phosphoglycolate phosphatase
MPDSVPQPLLVFDLDGTLANTAADLIGTLNIILTAEGLEPIPLSQARSVVGAGARMLIARGFALNGRQLSEAKLTALFADFLTHYEAHIADRTALYPGVVACLDRLEAAGYAFAVCTNKLEKNSVKLLKILNIAQRFRAICGQDTFAVQKPDPAALLGTIARARGDRRRALMIGDSRTDIDTAKAAGIPVIAVDFGYSDRHVKEFEPDRIISHFDDLFDAVRDLDLDLGPPRP